MECPVLNQMIRIFFKIFSSETTEQICLKLSSNDHLWHVGYKDFSFRNVRTKKHDRRC